jgi:hypothetical protein
VPNIKTQNMARMSLQERAIAIGLLEAGASHEQVCGSIPIVRFIAFQCMHSTTSPLHISIMNLVILCFISRLPEECVLQRSLLQDWPQSTEVPEVSPIFRGDHVVE